jgi:hypothetical protein
MISNRINKSHRFGLDLVKQFVFITTWGKSSLVHCYCAGKGKEPKVVSWRCEVGAAHA